MKFCCKELEKVVRDDYGQDCKLVWLDVINIYGEDAYDDEGEWLECPYCGAEL